jgi:hypothetical protein
MTGTALSAEGLAVTYGSILALDAVRGGAGGDGDRHHRVERLGKPTFLRAADGLIRPTGGTLRCPRARAEAAQATDVDAALPMTVREAVRLALPAVGTGPAGSAGPTSSPSNRPSSGWSLRRSPDASSVS